MRIALDTNVLVAAIATRGICADLLGVVLAEHQLILSQTVRAELSRVLRSKLDLGPEIIDEYEALLGRHAVLAGATGPVTVEVRNPSDAQVLADALGGGADVLVTGDRDLLSVAPQAPIPIVDPRGFWDLLRQP